MILEEIIIVIQSNNKQLDASFMDARINELNFLWRINITMYSLILASLMK